MAMNTQKGPDRIILLRVTSEKFWSMKITKSTTIPEIFGYACNDDIQT